MIQPHLPTRLISGLAIPTVLWVSLLTMPLAQAASSFTLFESGQVRPLALSPDGQWLFAANTPDNRLEVFHVHPHGLEHRASVPVGLEPVAAARSATEVWVVNHVSDSVSLIALSHGGVQAGSRTLLVGDEPHDIVFAGSGTAAPSSPRRIAASICRSTRSSARPAWVGPMSGCSTSTTWARRSGGAPHHYHTLY